MDKFAFLIFGFMIASFITIGLAFWTFSDGFLRQAGIVFTICIGTTSVLSFAHFMDKKERESITAAKRSY